MMEAIFMKPIPLIDNMIDLEEAVNACLKAKDSLMRKHADRIKRSK
jgi:hypothetical protein